MSINITRVRAMYNKWYQSKYYMNRDDWLFVACMIVGANLAFGLGLIIGLIIVWI